MASVPAARLSRRGFVKAAGALLGASALPVPLAFAADALPPSLQDALAGIVAQAIRASASPGIQVAAWQDGRAIASVARGYANLETSTPVSAASVFRAGSLTKQFTAALIAKLQEQGKLSVSDSLDMHLDFFRGKDAPTLLELIHHTAGVHDDQAETFDPRSVSQVELARRIAAQEQLYDFPPGTAWLYSNANYILLGAVVESVTGLPLSRAAQDLVFGPLGLADTRFDTDAEIVRHRASGYTPSSPGAAVPFANAVYIPVEQAGGAGAIRSTAGDLCRWHQALFSGKLVSRASLERMLAPALLKDGRPAIKGRFDTADENMGGTAYGYGLLLDRATKDGGPIAMHNGFINGFSAYLATHVPSLLTVACMCNADPNPRLPFRQLRRAVFAPMLQ